MKAFILIAALMAQATSASASSSFAQPARAIVPDFSRPILEFQCALQDGERNDIDFHFRVTGGRAVLRGGEVGGITPRKVEVVRDPTGIIGRFPDQYINRNDETGKEFNAHFGWKEEGSFSTGLYLQVHGVDVQNVRVAVIHDGRRRSFAAEKLLRTHMGQADTFSSLLRSSAARTVELLPTLARPLGGD